MEPLQFALLGLGIGAAYALLGQGIVLIYRGSGLLNFAQGGTAMVVANVFYGLKDGRNLGTGAALALALALALFIGAFMQLVVLRFLRDSSALVRLISTLALLTVLQGIGIVLWGGRYARLTEGLFPSSLVDFGNGLAITLDRLIMVGIAVLLTALLWVAFQRTRYGLATSAVAENEQSAQALGWSPTTIGAANWMLGSMLAGLAGIFIAPITGLTVATLVLMVIPGLAAALVGQFSSFWWTLAGGLAIGIAQSEAARYISSPGWADAIPFVLIIVVVVVRGRSLPIRGESADRPVRTGSGVVRPLLLLPVLVVAGLAVATFSSDWLLALTSTALMGLVALSLIPVTGYAGQISLAQLAIAGVGALAAGNASSRWGLPFEISVLIGTAAAMAVGLVVALPALRCRGANLAVVTIGLSLVIEELVLANSTLSNGVAGLLVEQPTLVGVDIGFLHPDRFAAVACGALIVCGLLVANIRRGASGRRLLAIRTNERAAASIGISVFAGKLYAFAVGAGLAGLAGAIAAFQFTRVDLSPYTSLGSITLVVQTVIGGIGYVAGAVIGGIGSPRGLFTQAVSGLNETWPDYVIVITGVVGLLTLLSYPNGVADTVVRLFRRQGSDASADWSSSLETRATAGGAETRVPLSVSDLTVSFGGVRAVRGVTFDVKPGEVLALIGPNGAGKTTVIDAISGFVASGGDVRLGDATLTESSPRRRSKAGIGRTFQSVELFDDMTVLDNIRTAAESKAAGSYMRDIVLPRSAPLPPVACQAIRDLKLTELLHLRTDELSAGQQRLVGIARILAGAPQVVMLDEPASGLDDGESEELALLIRHLADEWKLAVLLVEHNVKLVSDVSDRVIALAQGSVIAQGTCEEVLRTPAVVSAYLGDEDDEDDEGALPLPTNAERVER